MSATLPEAKPERSCGRAAERKRARCNAHASQAPEKFYALQDQITRLRGIERRCRQSESFIRHVQSPDFVLPLE